MRCKLVVGTFIAVHVLEVYICEYKKVSTSLHLTGDEVKLRHQRKYICVHLKVVKPTFRNKTLHSAVAHEAHVLLAVLFFDVKPLTGLLYQLDHNTKTVFILGDV